MRQRTPTPRQVEIAQLFADGYSLEAAAEHLGISWNTAKTHGQNLLVRLGVHSMGAAIAIGFREGWLK